MKRRVGNPKHDYAKEWITWRKAHGFTQVSLAFTLGITRKTVYNVESGNHKPYISTRTKFRDLVARYEREQCLPKQ